MKKLDVIEWIGTIAAMIASALVATNIAPGIGYLFYLLSAIAVGYVVFKLKRNALLFLQLYFIVINIIGIFTWLI